MWAQAQGSSNQSGPWAGGVDRFGGGRACQATSPAAGQERLYIGTYTESSSIGIYRSGLDLGTGAFQTNSLLPAGWTGQNAAAEIAVHPSGRFLYGSNRGYNSGLLAAGMRGQTNFILTNANSAEFFRASVLTNN